MSGTARICLFIPKPNTRRCSASAVSTLTCVPGVMVLMENSATRLKRYAESLKKFRHPGNKIGCIVMNANPFTNGHRYLIQQAAAQCDWLHLFLVKEVFTLPL